MIRIIPNIPQIKAHWERRNDPIPYLMVPMSNGDVIRFNAEIPQPAFQCAIQNIRNMVVGYEKPADAGTSNRPAKKGLRGYYTTEKEN